MLPDRVIVNRPVVGPASVAVASVALIVTVEPSSLAIVTVALPGDPIMYAALELNVATTVSLLSTTVSFIGVTVITVDVALLGIVTLVPMPL